MFRPTLKRCIFALQCTAGATLAGNAFVKQKQPIVPQRDTGSRAADNAQVAAARASA